MSVLESRNPTRPGEVVWKGASAGEPDIVAALALARVALPAWAALGVEGRRPFLERWREAVLARADELARLITAESGKTLAESRLEVKSVADKVSITLDAALLARTADFTVDAGAGRSGRCTFRPHGVMAVIGPFNFPAHLPNGHIVPALVMGNTVVFKPSEKCPGVGAQFATLAAAAGLPHGVFTVLQGGAAVASRLVSGDEVDGVLFTGSWPVGRSIMQANLDRPGRMLALEMGGSNAAIVCGDAHLRQAVLECVRASFATTGQRCTCTRRIIVAESVASAFIPAFCKAASTLLVGPGDDETAGPVFMGPLISERARDAALRFQSERVRAGAALLVRGSALDREGWFMTPSVIQVPRFALETDEEVFGPVVQLAIAKDDDDAVEQANATKFGLAASIFTADEARFRRLAVRVRAGCVNWNTGTAGASSKLPFGGLGRSGNHRPAAAFAADSCAFPVAHMEVAGDEAAVPAGVLWDDGWLKIKS
ncbi:MAG: aldehyde dehydrogenase family protein [Planctomycetota bacterium]|nr:aldehyde dehydrogenase family protein [Planctomycetota bacterium]MDA1106004.1 aldehyde dehydrogenase family protein [Planctomycetota bacterium]